MRQLLAISLSIAIFSCILLGCTRRPQPKNDDIDENKEVVVAPKVKILDKKSPANIGSQEDQKDPPAPVDAEKQKYEDALSEAYKALGEQKWHDALVAFEAARTIQDSNLVKDEIARLKARVDQDVIVKNAVKNIETVLNDGKAEDAARLAKDALQVFGDRDEAAQLVQLRIQAEALQAVQNKEGNEARADRFKTEGESALKEKNLRAAALAFEQSLLARDDADVKTRYDGVREQLDKYDGLRKKAAELRGDPTRLDEAVESLKQAALAWDTLQIRQELDEAMLALQRRRDTVSVLDFELRNDVGAADAGAALADELLPLLKTKYDLVERAQLNRVIAELKLERGFVDDPRQQEQLGKLAKVRYIVVGSVRRTVAVGVQARLIDVQTGLVVQTAKLMAPTMDDALAQLPDLAKQLLMTDEEKLAAVAQMQRQVVNRAAVVPDNAVVPPAPLPPAQDAPPPVPIVFAANGAPPALDRVQVEVFSRLESAPQGVGAPAAPLPPAKQLGHRLLHASLELGDHHFRAGRFDEAQRRFEFALNLDPNNLDIRLRLERVQPHAFLVQGPPIVPVLPRLAVLNFATYGNARMVPTSLGYWTPNNLAPYFASRFDVVDPAEIYWFMDRMGMTMSDLMVDANARRWLGRAVGVRYFILGNHVETKSFDVNAYLIDAEFGAVQGYGKINVQNPWELKLRLPELAALTMMTRAERAAFAVAKQREFEALVVRGRRLTDERKFDLAVPVFVEALKIRPDSVQVRYYLEQARHNAYLFQFEIERRRQYEAQQAARAAAQQRQWELAQASEAARQRAVAEAALRGGADNKVRLDLRVQAQANLVNQAQIALQTKNFGVSVNFFQGAVGFAPPAGGISAAPPIVYQDYAQAQLLAQRAEQQRIADLTAGRDALRRRDRDLQLAAAQKEVIAEQKRAQEARAAQIARDEQAYQEGFKQGEGLLAQKNYPAALAAFQGAQRFKQTPEVGQKIATVVSQQADLLAKTQAQRDALLIERERRKAAESLAKRNEDLYKLALASAQQALVAKNYDVAQVKFDEAGQLYRTDAVLTGLRQVESGRAALVAEAKQAEAVKAKAATIQKLIANGNAAIDAKDYGAAIKSLLQAKALAPDNLDVRAGLLRAEQARDRMLAEASRKAEETDRQQNFARLLKSGKDSLASKQYHAAVANLSAALKLNPANLDAQQALKQAEKARDAAVTDAKAQAEAKVRAEAYQKKMNEGWLALQSKRYDEAIRAYGEAQKLQPGDKASREFLQEAESSKKAAADAVALAAKKRADELKKAADVQKALTASRAALAANDLASASKLLAQAKLLHPTDPEVLKASRELDQAQQRAAAAVEAQKKRLQAFEALLTAGKNALTAKKYPEALKALSSATTMMPESKEAQDLFRRAQTEARLAEEAVAKSKLKEIIGTGLAALKAKNYDAAEKSLRSAALVDPTNPLIVQGLKDIEAGRKAIVDEQQRQLGYQLAVNAGQKAMQAKKYTEAVTSFQQALKLLPNDTKARQMLQQAQGELDNAAKGQLVFQQAMDAGDKAMTAKNYAGAVKAYTEATKLNPNDIRARQLLAQAQQALQANVTQTKYLDAIKAGQSAFNTMKYDAAVKAFESALKLVPNDQQATLFLQQAQKALDSAKTEAAQKQAQYQEHMKAGGAALTGKKYDEAAAAYRAALKLMPKDIPATRGLSDALKALDASKVKTPPPADPTKLFDEAMQRGAALEKEKKFGDAMKAYQEAVKLRPKDFAAQQGMRKNQFLNHLQLGQLYLDQKMNVDAVRELEAALRIVPNEPQALKLLQKAKGKQ